MATLRRVTRRLSSAAAVAGPADHSAYQFVVYVGTSKKGWKGVVEQPSEGVSFIVSGGWGDIHGNNVRDVSGFKPCLVIMYLLDVLSRVWKKTEAASRGRILIYTTPPSAKLVNMTCCVPPEDFKMSYHHLMRKLVTVPFLSVEARSIFQGQNPADGEWNDGRKKRRTCIMPSVYPPPSGKGPQMDLDVQSILQPAYPSLQRLLVDARDSITHEPPGDEFSTGWYEIFPNCSEELLIDSLDVLHVLEKEEEARKKGAVAKGGVAQENGALCLRQKVERMRERRGERAGKLKRKRERQRANRAKKRAEMKANRA